MRGLILLATSLSLFACDFRKPESKEQAPFGAAKVRVTPGELELVSTLPSSYLGRCKSTVGETFTRNEGLETCIVISASNFTAPDGQIWCQEVLECRPSKDSLVNPSDVAVPNPVGDVPYVGGAPHFCQSTRRMCGDACLQQAPTEEQYYTCRDDCQSAYHLCMAIGTWIYPKHFDCDDFSFYFQEQCAQQGINCWGIGCSLVGGGGHAFNIVEQPDGNSDDATCRYCAAEPQASGGMSPLITCWNQLCGAPSVPPAIAMQQGWKNCTIFKGAPPPAQAGEPLAPRPACLREPEANPAPSEP